MKRSGVLIGVIVVAAGLAVWQALPSRGFDDPTKPARFGDLVKPGAAAGYNVLLITLDTTRPDYLGCYGRKEAETPAIDSLLQHGVRFDDAITPVPLTLPAHASIMTGLDPRHHGIHNNGTYFLSEEVETLAERFKRQGYDTGAFIGCFVVDARFGLGQGFDVYDFKVSDQGRRGPDTEMNERPANDVTNSAIQWLKNRSAAPGAPFFAWVHYYDPHSPLESPLSNMPRFVGKPYDAEIAFVDRHFKRLLDTLNQSGQRERTLIIVVSDHGESLNEHGEAQHGVFIYDATVKVALIVSCPTLFAGGHRVEDRMVSVLDIVPTLDSMMGMKPRSGLDGVNLLDHDDPARTLYLETYYPQEQIACSPLHGLRRRHDKLIHAPKPEYYDLSKDPRELTNLFDAALADMKVLQDRLAGILPEATASSSMSKRTMTAEEESRLAALGYVKSVVEDTSAEPCDPKDRLPLIQPVWEVTELVESGKYDQAEAILKEALAQTGGSTAILHLLGELYDKTGRHEDAVELLEQAAKQGRNPYILSHLAQHLYKLRRYDEMEETLQALEILDPLRGTIPMLRGDRWLSEGRYDKAVEQYEKALSVDPERVGHEVRDKLKKAREALGGASG